MKTDTSRDVPRASGALSAMDAQIPTDASPAVFDVLLQRPIQKHDLPNKVDGLLIGVLRAVDESGQARVQLIDFTSDPLDAISMVPLGPSDIGTHLVVGFQGGAVTRPMILGRVWSPTVVDQTSEPLPSDTGVPRRRIVLAEEELELRCGEAVILLRSDGHIHLRGRTITSHAEAGQRIRGGSVQIN